jgi:hypothetical protein
MAFPFPLVSQQSKLRDILTKENTINVAPWMTQLLPHLNREVRPIFLAVILHPS